MKIGIPTTAGSFRYCVIDSVEHVSASPGPRALGLTVKCTDHDEMSDLQKMQIHDVDCPVTESVG
jgi:hypothetical protein